jgi:hypothetical protein
LGLTLPGWGKRASQHSPSGPIEARVAFFLLRSVAGHAVFMFAASHTFGRFGGGQADKKQNGCQSLENFFHIFFQMIQESYIW